MLLILKINNYKKYKGRDDVKTNSWFRCSNTLLDDPDLYGFDHEEMLCWIYFLSLSSRKNDEQIKINFDHARVACRLSSNGINSAAKKLAELKIIEIIEQSDSCVESDTYPIRARVDNKLSTCSTDRQTDKTEQDKQTDISCSEPASSVPSLKKKPEKVLMNLTPSRQIEVKKDLLTAWADTFPKEYLEMEFKKARNWIIANEHKSPKKNWAQFLNNWLNRGWEDYRKTLTSNPPKISVDDLNDILGGR